MVWCILSFIFGTIMGVALMCCLFVAKESDKHIEMSDADNS